MTISGKLFRLGAGRHSELADEALLAKAGRSALPLVQDDGLRITLITLAAGGVLTEHTARGPISVHVVAGDITFEAEGETWNLEPGDLLSLSANVPHAVRSENGGSFVLTISLQNATPGS